MAPALRLRALPIRHKLLLLGLATSACAILAMGAAWLILSYFLGRHNLRAALDVDAEIVTHSIAAAVGTADRPLATTILFALRNNIRIDEACVYDIAGAVFAAYARLGLDGACPLPAPPKNISHATVSDIVITKGIHLNGDQIGLLLLRGNFRPLERLLRLQAWSALGGLLVGLVVALTIAARLRRTIADPIQELATTSSRIATMGDYSVRALGRGEDELGELARVFNEMVAGIERRDDQLRATSRVKDEFLATLSHELRTPLTAVLGWLQILQMYPPDATVLERALASMERNTRAQIRLIEDMLDVSRIITGKLQLKPDVVDLAAVVEAAVEVARPTALAKNIRLTCETLPSQFVMGDAERLQQVMWNLLSNGVKFTPPGGEVQVTMTQHPGNVSVRVRDTGAGLSADFLPHAFDRFRQADGSVSRQHGGLGLGLAIVHDLVTMHGGHVQAESEGPGRGASFTVVLPRSEGAHRATDTVQRRVRPEDLDGLLILAVDDNSESLDIVGEALSRAGARVELVDRAARALSALSQRRFDVLVCDLAMPDVDGFELLREIRRHPTAHGRPLPAVAVSAHATIEAQDHARLVGFQGFVTKPYAFDTLVQAVAKAAGRGV